MEADLAKIYKLVLNKRIKSVYLVPLVNNIRWKMISGVNSTHICDDLALWESDEEMGWGQRAKQAKISKLVMNKWIKLVNLVPLVNNIRWKMISGATSTHICDDLDLWESDEKMGWG